MVEFVERRRNRAIIRRCEQCDAPDAQVVLRTESELYVRCDCGWLWSQRKPAQIIPIRNDE